MSTKDRNLMSILCDLPMPFTTLKVGEEQEFHTELSVLRLEMQHTHDKSVSIQSPTTGIDGTESVTSLVSCHSVIVQSEKVILIGVRMLDGSIEIRRVLNISRLARQQQ